MRNTLLFLNKYAVYLLSIMVLLPFILLSFYNHPVGTHDWDWIGHYGYPEFSVLDHIVYQYQYLTGRYFTIFLLALTPFWFSIVAFKLYPIIILSFLLLSLYYLFHSILRKKIHKKKLLEFSLLFMVLFIHGLAGVFELIYTLSSALQYLMGCLLSVLLMGTLFRLHHKFSWSLFLFSILLIISINGTNEINLLIINILLGSLCFLTTLSKKKITWWLGLFMLVSILSASVEILAPGNFDRIETYPNSRSISFSLMFSIPAMFQNFISWFVNTPLLIVTLLLWKPLEVVGEKSDSFLFQKVNFKWLLILSLTIQFLPLMFLLYASGPNSLPERVIDVLYFHFLLSWFVIIISFQRNYKLNISFTLPPTWKLALSTFVLFFLLFNPLKINRNLEAPKSLNLSSISRFISIDNNVGKAWLDLIDGSAAHYNEMSLNNYNLIKNCKTETCYIKHPSHLPNTIYQEVFDRRHTKKGEQYMSWFFTGKFQKVYYEKEEQ